MIDINLIRENKELVKENIKKKFQDEKLPLVDEVYDFDIKFRNAKQKVDELRCKRNEISDKIGTLMREGKKDDAMKVKDEVKGINEEIAKIEENEEEYSKEIKKRMMVIPQIIDESVPIGKDDTENVEIERFGEPVVPNYEIPYNADICEKFNGLDKESAGRTSGNGFYYLMGDIARLHSALITYRDFMIEKGFIYCIPPFMIRSDVVSGVMSFKEMEDMMYKIDGEDLYLIGTSEHSMIGKFKDQIVVQSRSLSDGLSLLRLRRSRSGLGTF